MSTAYHAAWVLPVSQPPIRHGYITVDAGRVIDVGAALPSGAKIVDLGNVAILPKPINAHTHLEFSDLTQPLGKPRHSFANWIAEVLAQRAARTTPKAGSIAQGLCELSETLTAALGEIATLPSSPSDYGVDPLPGIAFHELLSTDLDRGLARLSEATALADNWPSDFPLRFGLSPHAPYTVHWELLNKSIELAAQRNWPVAMHLGESLDEMELLRSHSGKMHQLLVDRGVWNPASLPRGIELTDYLTLLAKAPRALAIHGNFFGPGEHEILARHRDHMSLIICPRTCDYFLPTLPPISELLAKGVQIALGTDSRATNPDLDVWSDAKFLLERSDLSPSDILRLATLSGAEALGLSERFGHISPGISESAVAMVQLSESENGEDAAISSALQGKLAPLAH